MKVGSYYQAHVAPAQGWFFVGSLRSFEHIAFDRTLDVEQSIFEFFVPEDTEKYFVAIMDYYLKEQIIKDLRKLPNRLAQDGVEL